MSLLKNEKKRLVSLSGLIIVLFLSIQVKATNYYVSNSGKNNASGTSSATAWKTISTVNSKTFSPGDSILFKCGDVWREELLIKNSGQPGAPIVYATYGTGPKPRIYGSNRAENWTAVDGYTNIWQSGTILSAPRQRTGHSVSNHPSSIFFGETDGTITWGNMENIHLNSEDAPMDICLCNEVGERFSLMDKEYDWCWQDDHVYVYSPENPGTRYAFIEVPQRESTISMASHPPEEHIVIDGLELMYAFNYGFNDGWPMNVVVRGLTIRNCHIGYMGVKGAASAIGLQIWHSDMLVQNNDIHDCGRRSISYNVYGDVRNASLVFENVVFENNVLHNGYHTTGFDISCGYTDTFRNFIFRNNYIWDDPADDPTNRPNDFTSMGIFLSAENATFTGFKVYNNILKYTKQKGIAINGISDSDICHNTFYGMNERAGGNGYRGMISVSGKVNSLRIKNNIFYGNVKDQFVLRCVHFSGTSHTGTIMDNNLFFHEDDTQPIVNIDAGGSYRMSRWDAYKSDTGWGEHSPEPGDPLFVNAPNDLTLTENSPAVGSAVPIPWITTDYLDNPRDPQNPDLGAFEYNDPADVSDEKSGNIMNYELRQNYPNPFNPITRIVYYLPKEANIEFILYNTIGQLVSTNFLGHKTLGEHVFNFDAHDLPSGVYYYQLKSPEYSSVKKCMVLK